MRRATLILVGLTLLLGATGCTRLRTDRPIKASLGPGSLPRVKIVARDALPLEFGDIVAVTSRADYSNWTQAWFVRPDKSIVIVWINSQTGYILEDALEIPRR
jgi:hypothetical protein